MTSGYVTCFTKLGYGSYKEMPSFWSVRYVFCIIIQVRNYHNILLVRTVLLFHLYLITWIIVIHSSYLNKYFILMCNNFMGSFARQTTHSMHHLLQHEYRLSILYVCSKIKIIPSTAFTLAYKTLRISVKR